MVCRETARPMRPYRLDVRPVLHHTIHASRHPGDVPDVLADP